MNGPLPSAASSEAVWARVQLARNLHRPRTLEFIAAMADEGASADQLRATWATHRGELDLVLRQLGLNKDESAKYVRLLDARDGGSGPWFHERESDPSGGGRPARSAGGGEEGRRGGVPSRGR